MTYSIKAKRINQVVVLISIIFLLSLTFVGFAQAQTSHLVFTVGTNQTINGGQNSNLITVQRVDGNGNPITIGYSCVYLQTNQEPFLNYSTGSDGNFYYTNGSLMNPSLPSVLIPQDSSSASFYYEDQYNGNWIITASSDGSCPYIPNGFSYGSGASISINVILADGTTATLYQNIGQSLSNATTTLSIVNGITPTINAKSTFTESGLPSGTSWSVTLDSTQYSSTTNTITINASATSQHSWSISNTQVNGVSYSASPFGGVVGASYSSVYANGVIWGSVVSAPTQQITFSPTATSTPTSAPTTVPTQTPTQAPTQNTSPTPTPTPSVPEFPALAIFPFFAVVILLSIVFVRKRIPKK